MPAVITFAFDPLLHVGDLSVRMETVALAAIILAALLMVTRIGRITPMAGPYVPAPTLRPSDLPFLILGIVPGAVLGGRLDYVLVHLDYYAAHPAAVVDPTQGGLGLGLAVPGAILGGAVIARLVDAPLDRWLHASVLPMLFVLGAGKFAGVLAATGQGAPSDLPWATAYLGDGPWSSLAAYLPSHPSQVYEAIGTVAILAVMGLAIRAGAFAHRNGSAAFVALILWALMRGAIVLTWRDASVLGPFRAEELILLAVIVGSFAALVRIRAR
ncbi:MAG: prolipoprotein diacylglyceryl transferase [Chloroflexi bacterium]|nr:prolipoprotein diacylglyceryl transferase [Chloroflexota bacterium]